MESQGPMPSEGDLPRLVPEVIGSEFEPASEKPQVFSIAEGNLATEAISKLPAVALERFVKAAEANEPLEGQLERKEVREEPQHATSVGSVLAGIVDRTPNLSSKMLSGSSSPVTPLLNTQKPTSVSQQLTGSLYRLAVMAGFGAAIVLLLIWAAVVSLG